MIPRHEASKHLQGLCVIFLYYDVMKNFSDMHADCSLSIAAKVARDLAPPRLQACQQF